MDGFKNSTKTHYMKGGSCDGYAKGGAVKGAAKISKVMGEFKSGALHSGSKKGPEVTNPKQAVAIALSEARKAGAKVPAKPVKKWNGGPIVDESGEERVPNLANAPDTFRKRKGLEVKQTTVRDVRKVTPKAREMVTERRATSQRDVREPLIRNPLMDKLTQLPSQRGEFPIRRGHGGLAVMPRKK